MRKTLAERNWAELKNEARLLKGAGESFGFGSLTALAIQVEERIPEPSTLRTRGFFNGQQAREAAETLFLAIDQILAENSVRFL